MMIDRKMEDALNEQITAEIHSAHLYLAMSSQAAEMNFPGIANWMYVQYQEELTHAMKFYHFIIERGGRAKIDGIEKPKESWRSVEAMFEDTLSHEKYVTERIYKLVDLAIELRDHATNNFLQWYVAEQVEEEANAVEILERVKMVQESKNGLYMLNKELGKRQFVDATKKE